MRKQAALVLLVAVACAGSPQTTQAPQTDDQKSLYAAGAMLAQGLAFWQLKPEEAAFAAQGFSDAASGRPLAVDPDAMRPKIQAFVQARTSAGAVAEKKASEPFLAQAAASSGAKKTASGLIISEIQAGTGPTPKPEDMVKVHYHGTLIDGTVFDSSVQRGEPASFPVAGAGVIRCWTEGLQLMKVGEKAKLVCPENIAYGDRGALPRIRPGATIVFEVELLGIDPREADRDHPHGDHP